MKWLEMRLMALPHSLVGMEACCGAYHLTRELAILEHDVRLMAPQFFRPFLKSNGNDYLDVEAIAESRPATRDALRRFRRTTVSLYVFPVAPNLLDQDFMATGPNRKWPIGACLHAPVG